MADPVIHVTNGIPDSGTGNITTLGLTVQTQGATTSGLLGPLVQGAVTTAAPTYTTATTNPLSLDTAGNLRISATQTGTWTVQPGNTANTTAWLVTGTGGTFPVTGTFWQATQPVSIAATVASNITQFGGTNISTGTGAGGAGIPRVTISNDSTVNPQTIGTWGLAASTQNVATPTNGQLVMGEFNTTPTTITSGNTSPLQLDSAGNLKVNTIDPAVYNAGTAWNNATTVNTAAAIVNSTAITYDNFIGQITQTTTITGGVITFEESFDNGTTYATIPPQRFIDPATYLPLPNPYTCVASTNQRFHIIPAGTCQIRARLSTVIAGTGTVTVSWTQCPITSAQFVNAMSAGDVASGNTDSGWPVKIGGLAKTTNPTAVSDGQRVAALFDKQGKQVVVGAIRQLKGVQRTVITTTTETTVVTAGAAGVFNDVYAIVVTNTSATTVFVDFRDATAGTIRMSLAAPATDTRGFTVSVDSAMVQAVAANNWTATLSGAASSIEISMLYVSNL